MFEYFPTNYPLSLGVALALGMGGVMPEINDACRPLLALPAGAPPPVVSEAWFQNWSILGQRLERLGSEAYGKGWGLSASDYYFRATAYYLLAERVTGWADPRRLATYRHALGVFENGHRLSGHKTQRVEVTGDQGQPLSGYLRIPDGEGPFPALIFFNGFDTIKEMHYLMYGDYAARRGLAVLYIDQEGTGEAMRLHDIKKRVDSEKSATPFVDLLEQDPRIDPDRIGVMGISNGGYDAPRAAVFETRLKCVACLGAFFNGDDYAGRLERDETDAVTHGLSDLDHHMMKVMGASNVKDAYRLFAKRDLSGVIEKLAVPLLVVHGENDRQVPLFHAERTVAGAVNSPDVEFKLFSLSEGCAEHCGGDNTNMHARYIFDWSAGVFNALAT